MPPHIYIVYMYIVTHAGSSTKLLIIGLVILAVTITTLFLAIILTVVLVLKKSTHRRLKNPVETPKHPRDDHESGLDERGMCFYCAMISW